MAPSAVASYEGGENASIRDLWQNKRITDFSRIHQQCHKSIYFALNVKGKEGENHGITNIGLALVRDLMGGGKQANSPTDLTSIVQKYGVDGHDFRRSFRSRHDWNYDKSSITKSCCIKRGEIDNAINEILESARLISMASIPCCLADFTRESDINGKSGARFVMVVLGGGHSEFDAIASTIPSIIPYISHWFDLNDLVASMSATPMQTNPFSLRDTMLSLGFGLEHVPKIWGGRPAGMDAVRMIGILIELCSRPASETFPSLYWREITTEAMGNPTKTAREFPVHDQTHHGRKLDATQLTIRPEIVGSHPYGLQRYRTNSRSGMPFNLP
ncbi:hypothetical protein F4821DRAFT_262245 [Hypoxylon rubiginosum]|uniref:Uncharacterized protein n=1 Tax=Hypoxylon rubiginosum TaxID=110542 RepID=A0ACC0CUD4_9PEZI|nr:hypothetical protein F4821DRAFT_262245 [Hypoxylon rubiginosum]